MNETVKLLTTRRSVAPHLLAGPGPTPEELDLILTVASRVPDHGRMTPWRFVVIEGEAQHRLGETIAAAFKADHPLAEVEAVERERAKLARSPLVVAVVSRAKPHVKIPEWEQELSVGAACMNLMIAAAALGFGTSWLTDWLAFDRRILDALGLEPDERLAGYIYVGRVKEPPAERARPALAEIVTRL